MRRGVVLAVFVVIPIAGAFVACGLDESGTAADGSVDVTTKDGAADVVSDVISDAPIDVPQACSTLDATACVDAGLPDGWTFAAVAPGDTPCPSSDYTQNVYIHDPVADGGCLCACTASGSFDCSGSVNAGTQPGCNGNKSFTFDAGNERGVHRHELGRPAHFRGPAAAARHRHGELRRERAAAFVERAERDDVHAELQRELLRRPWPVPTVHPLDDEHDLPRALHQGAAVARDERASHRVVLRVRLLGQHLRRLQRERRRVRGRRVHQRDRRRAVRRNVRNFHGQAGEQLPLHASRSRAAVRPHGERHAQRGLLAVDHGLLPPMS